MEKSHFFASYWGRFITSSAVIASSSLAVVVIFDVGNMLEGMISLLWFTLVWTHGPTGILQPWSLLLITLAIQAVAARWTWATVVAALWFLYNVIVTLGVLLSYDGKS